MDDDAQAMLRQTLTKVLEEPAAGPLVTRLRELGWHDMEPDDRRVALQLLFECKGDLVAPGNALGPAMADELAIVLSRSDLSGADLVLGSSLHPDGPGARLDGDQLLVQGFALADPAAGQHTVVGVARQSGLLQLAVVPPGQPWVTGAATGSDPSAGLVAVETAVATSAVSWIEPAQGAAAWEAAVALGRWCLATELLAIARHVIAGAVTYAGQRRQYGRPIGSFQAVQHRLASAYASVVGAGHVVEESSVSGDPWVALVAKALSGRAAEDACTQAQQVYGAIGFTWEHELHRYIRRMYVLDWLLGDWRSLEAEIGRRLHAGGVVPRIGTL